MLRARASCIVIRDDRVLLMHRQRDGREYYVLPGGGVEAGESAEQACRRELAEETPLQAGGVRLVGRADEESGPDDYFLIEDPTGTTRLAGPEAERDSPTNSYRLEWIGIDDLARLPLVPPTAAGMIMKAYRLV
ncbi:DNA mismatch repair protein MutT [Microlunatus endophyticus]|uniref:DNA mismatch repair protein MutT n=1 Tax=Microlunatus endophyticus TaxID=1716077 RepID=A0A917SDX3_9ACTN|nr:DNA mismatch repair protein MutT [Microlunatus endophyticus]